MTLQVQRNAALTQATSTTWMSVIINVMAAAMPILGIATYIVRVERGIDCSDCLRYQRWVYNQIVAYESKVQELIFVQPSHQLTLGFCITAAAPKCCQISSANCQRAASEIGLFSRSHPYRGRIRWVGHEGHLARHDHLELVVR
jgi:hypothetical protein